MPLWRKDRCARRLQPGCSANFRCEFRDLAAADRPSLARTSALKRAWGMPGAQAPAALACEILESTRVSSPQVHRKQSRHSTQRGMVLTVYSVLSPATNSFLSPSSRIKVLSARLSRHRLRKFSTQQRAPRTTRLHRPPQRHSSCAPFDRSRGSTRPAITLCA